MRRFELVEGKSRKFWEVSVSDASMTVRYGRIGADGTTQTKSFADATKAEAQAQKLVREKLAKGYVEAGSGSPIPASVPKPKGDPVIDVPSPSPPTTASPSAPSGAFQWTKRWQSLTPHFRGEAMPAPPIDTEALLRDNPLLTAEQDDLGIAKLLGGAGCLPKHAAIPFGFEDTLTELSADKIKVGDDAYWRRLFATAGDQRMYRISGYASYNTTQFAWAIAICAGLRGIVFATELFFETLTHRQHKQGYGYGLQFGDDGLAVLRLRLSVATESEHQEALKVARTLTAGTEFPLIVAAHVFAIESDLIDAALAVAEKNARSDLPLTLLFTTRLSLAQARRLAAIERIWGYLYSAEMLIAGVGNLIQLHGNDALPFVAAALDHQSTADKRKVVLPLLRAFDNADAFAALIERIEQKDVVPHVDQIVASYPHLALRLGAERASARRSKAIDSWLARVVAANASAIPSVVSSLAPEPAAYLEAVARKVVVSGEEAKPESLPELLRSPPWLAGMKKPDAPSAPIELAVVTEPESMQWPPGLREAWLEAGIANPAVASEWVVDQYKGLSLIEAVLKHFGLKHPDARKKVLAGERPKPSDYLGAFEHYNFTYMLEALPEHVALAVWETAPAERWYEPAGDLAAWIARVGLPALSGLLHFTSSHVERGLTLALPFRSTRVAPLAAAALLRAKKAKLPAQRWLFAHAEVAAIALLRAATQGKPTERDEAEHALRWLAANNRRDDLDRGAARYGANGTALLSRILDFDPLSLYPRKLPKLPAFFVPGGFARPRLMSGELLSIPAVQHIGTMLAFSTLEARYPGLDVIATACTRDSLAAFAWDLFEAWLQSGAPGKEQWAFAALAHFGTDETARRLAPLIRQWPGEAAHARAVFGLDVLGAIGTDVALMHLNGIAQKVRFKALQDRARDRIDAIAQARGLTAEELADRLVPDLGLDERGTLMLDFGARRFTVGFDEQLQPFVRDDAGSRLKDLPKPTKSDDGALATAAVDTWKGLKKDARAIASLQIRRFEFAMVDRRRWSLGEFRAFMVEHPLLRHLVQRVLWGAYLDDGLATCFRVAEDGTFADREDSACVVPDNARIGIAHPLEIDEATLRAFGQIFADYEVLQPFRQIDRETYRLSDDEAKKVELDRFSGKKVATGSVFGLENKGWRRGDPQDSGWIGWFERPLGNGLHAEVGLDPGTIVGDIKSEPTQSLRSIVVRRAGAFRDEDRLPLSRLDPILASEVLRDLDLLN